MSPSDVAVGVGEAGQGAVDPWAALEAGRASGAAGLLFFLSNFTCY